MRKLFRFKYESCNKTCYAWCQVLPEELNKLSVQERQDTVNLMVEAHNRLCDNPDYSFGVDMDDATHMFVAHFRTPKSTETYLSDSFGDCVKEVCGQVLKTDIPQVAGNCTFGDNGAEDLGKEILRACVDEVFREEHHQACPCHV
jgi:hypothetical protein